MIKAGFQCFFVNFRGTGYSTQHESCSSPYEYFQYSWGDLGYYDVTATVTFIWEEILEGKEDKKPFLVGVGTAANAIFAAEAFDRCNVSSRILGNAMISPEIALSRGTGCPDIGDADYFDECNKVF